jgi:hypothetical protein
MSAKVTGFYTDRDKKVRPVTSRARPRKKIVVKKAK